MKTKQTCVFLLFMFIGSLISFGAKYEGIAKVKGQMMDLWVSIEISDNEATIDLGEGTLTLTGTCKKSGTSKNPIYTFKNPKGDFGFTLKSTDGGSTLEGKFPIDKNNSLDMWLLKLPDNMEKTTLSDEELKQILENKDGYTSFIKIIKQGGTTALTSDFVFEPDGTFNFIGDSSKINELFKQANGSYSISEGNVILNLGNELKREGTIYNNGDYIVIPIGNMVRGGNFTIVLIR